MKRCRTSVVALTILLASTLVVVACQSAAPPPAATQAPAKPAAQQPAPAQPTAAPAFPTRTLEMVCPYDPGGGSGILAQRLLKIINDEKLSPQPVEVSYKPGASGRTGWAYTKGRKGDAHTFSIAAFGFLSLETVGTDAGLKYEDFTPIALLGFDEQAFIVHPDSPFKTMQDVIEAAKKSPKSLSLAVGAESPSNAGGTAMAMLEVAAGIKFNAIPLTGGTIPATIMGRQTDVGVGELSEVSPMIEAGRLRPLAVLSENRLPQWKDIPTLKELGYNVVLSMPRHIVAPAGIPKHQEEWLIDLFSKVVKTKGWAEYTSQSMITPTPKYIAGAEFAKWLSNEVTKVTDVFVASGVIKKK